MASFICAPCLPRPGRNCACLHPAGPGRPGKLTLIAGEESVIGDPAGASAETRLPAAVRRQCWRPGRAAASAGFSRPRHGHVSSVVERAGGAGIVIVGGAMAGGNAAVTLREEGYRDRVTIIGAEPGVPFGRPPLSKTYLRSAEDLAGWLVRPASWYEEHDVDRLVGSSVAVIDTAAHTVRLGSGQELPYQQVLIATGGRNRKLGLPGSGLPGVHYLRTVADCEAIKAEAVAGRRAVIVGMSFIGSEVAASLTQLGVHVTAIFPGRFPLERVLGGEVGAVFDAIHRANGVELLAGEQVATFEGTERLEAVTTASGVRVACDFAVAGIGIEPVVPAVAGQSVAQDNGVLVDELCRASAADVYAAGDVANHLHPLFGRVRVEHYNNAEKQGAAAARSMLGSDAPYDYLYSFWSDQYEHKLEYVGHATKWDELVIRGSLRKGQFVGFYLVNGIVRAAVGLDRGGDPELDPDQEMAAAARLVAAAAQPAPKLLADERVDLRSLGG
jgi:3-phenylpropionate/trans-cinnamate dioxygenase ferredoxin reductase component